MFALRSRHRSRHSLIPLEPLSREPLFFLHREMSRLFDDAIRDGFGSLPRGQAGLGAVARVDCGQRAFPLPPTIASP